MAGLVCGRPDARTAEGDGVKDLAAVRIVVQIEDLKSARVA